MTPPFEPTSPDPSLGPPHTNRLEPEHGQGFDRLNEVGDILDAVEEAINQSGVNILSSLIDQIESAAPTCNECHARLIGQCDNCMDTHESPVRKCFYKAMGGVDGNIGGVYALLAGLGVRYPTMEEVIFGNTTGRFLESVGYGQEVSTGPEQTEPTDAEEFFAGMPCPPDLQKVSADLEDFQCDKWNKIHTGRCETLKKYYDNGRLITDPEVEGQLRFCEASRDKLMELKCKIDTPIPQPPAIPPEVKMPQPPPEVVCPSPNPTDDEVKKRIDDLNKTIQYYDDWFQVNGFRAVGHNVWDASSTQNLVEMRTAYDLIKSLGGKPYEPVNKWRWQQPIDATKWPIGSTEKHAGPVQSTRTGVSICPTIRPKSEAVNFFKTYSPPDWNSFDACQPVTSTLGSVTNAFLDVRQQLGWYKAANGNRVMPAWAKAIYDNLPMGLDTAFFEIGNELISALVGGVAGLVGVGQCLTGPSVLTNVVAAIGGFLERWLGPEVGRMFMPFRLYANYFCPQEIPSVAELNRGFLGGAITEEQWKCFTRAGNVRDTLAKAIRDTDRTRPNIEQVLTLNRRDKLTKEEYAKRVRELGVTDQKDLQRLEELIEQYPGFDDIIRFMIRDVFNDRVIKDFGYDQGFAANYTGKALDYGKHLGVSEELAKYYWRAHWLTPSNTQLYEMLHRLRPGDVDASVETKASDVQRMLEVNDNMPWFVPRLMAISYRPLTRTDAQRAFQIGSIDKDQLRKAYLDEGYNDTNADILVKFTEDLTDKRNNRALGLISVREGANAYSRGDIGLTDFRSILRDNDLTQSQERTAIDAAEKRFIIRRNGLWNKRTRREFKTGEIDASEAVTRLMLQGLTNDEALRMVDLWRGEMDVKGKELTAAQMCKMLGKGLVSAEEMAKRLVRIGYRAEDAKLIVGLCDEGITEQQLKSLEKQLSALQRKIAADQKAQAKAIEKEQKERLKELNKQRQALS
jgi:hypothetical protein